VYDAELRELCAPHALPVDGLSDFLAASGVTTVVGEVARTLPHGRILASAQTVDLPHARCRRPSRSTCVASAPPCLRSRAHRSIPNSA
jgi:hypothetical protein